MDCSNWIKLAPLIAHHFSFPTLTAFNTSAMAWSTYPFTQETQHKCTQKPKEKSDVCSLSHLPPKVPELKQFIEASLYGHGFWNSNCYLIWQQVLAPLHLRANLEHPNLLSTCITQQSSLNAIIILFYLPHLQRIMSFKVQHRVNVFF